MKGAARSDSHDWILAYEDWPKSSYDANGLRDWLDVMCSACSEKPTLSPVKVDVHRSHV